MDLNDKQKKFEIDFENIEVPLIFSDMFANNNPVHVEIGCGKGEFISKKAYNFKNINFLGIDTRKKRILCTLKKIDENLDNIFLCRLFVDNSIEKVINKNSIDVIYIQHPDPWPKRRHFKNRLFQDNFIDSLNILLKNNGEIRIATDHVGYSKWIVKMFGNRDDFFPIFENGFTLKKPDDHIETYFEKTWKKKGSPPIFMFYKKIKDIRCDLQKKKIYRIIEILNERIKNDK